jgi:hypothetical protein
MSEGLKVGRFGRVSSPVHRRDSSGVGRLTKAGNIDWQTRGRIAWQYRLVKYYAGNGKN